ncbi:hypothetical protein ACOJBO_42735 [Rhizobium beringeri]
MANDDEALLAILSEPQKTDLYYGVDILAKGIMAMMEEGTWIEDLWNDGEKQRRRLEDLIVSLGSRVLFNPEGGASYPYKTRPLSDPIDHYLDVIERKLGVDFHFPNPFAGEIGIVTSRGIATERMFAAIYQAYRIRELRARDCLEIGGGMGRTAYYARQLGLGYTIIDLLLVSMRN